MTASGESDQITQVIAVVMFVVGCELALWCRARFDVFRCRYSSTIEAELALHWRLVHGVLVATGWLIVTTLRLARYFHQRSNTTARLTAALIGAYWALRTSLEDRLVRLEAALRGRRGRRVAATQTTLTDHSVTAFAPIAGDGASRTVCAMPIISNPGGSSSRSDAGASLNDPLGGAGGTRSIVRTWHGRVVNVGLGLAAGSAVAGVVWLTGVGRAVGAFEHIGGVPFVVTLCVTIGVIGGLAAHRGHESSHDGFARRHEIRRWVSGSAVRRSAGITRPGTTTPGRHPITHCGTLLGRLRGTKLWATLMDVILIIAPPQTGKTAYLGGRIIDAPGPVVATSTKADVYVHTAALRASRGPVWVFNPERLGQIDSTFRWSPLEGCTDPEVASERAGYLLSGAERGTGDNAVFWREMNAKLLRCLLLAAALTDRSMRDVWAWINDSGDPMPLRIMQSEHGVPLEWISEMRQLLHDTPERTRQSVYLTLAQTMQFMTSPAIATAICPEPGEPTFSIERFLDGDATLYLLGSDRPYASLVPLFAAITGYVFEEAKRAAAQRFSGRLDPPLTLALDEAALICPVPLPSMTADSGGRGIQLFVAVQSPSQLYERWGQRGGETIFNNSNAKLVLGGLAHARDLDDLSRVCGERDDEVRGFTNGTGGQRSSSTSIRRLPVLAPHEIRQIGDGKALLLYRNMAPVIVGIERVWDRRDVKAAAKRQRLDQLSALRTTRSPAERELVDASERDLPVGVLRPGETVAASVPAADGNMSNVIPLVRPHVDGDEDDDRAWSVEE